MKNRFKATHEHLAQGGIQPSHRAPQREVHLRDLATVVLRYWLLVILLAGLVGAGAYYSGRQAVPLYQSRLTVQINSPEQVFSLRGSINFDELALRTNPILSEVLVLTTQGLGLEVVDHLSLQLQPSDPTVHRGDVFTNIAIDPNAANPGTFRLVVTPQGYQLLDVTGAVLASGSVVDTVAGPGFSFAIRQRAAPIAVDFGIIGRPLAAARVTGGVSYSVRDGTNAVDLSYTSTDPTLVPLILNEAALQLRNMGVQRSLASASSRRQHIEAQLEQSDSAFQRSLRDIQQFREGRQITDLSAQAAAIVQTIQRLEQDRQLELVRLSTLRDAISVSDTIGVETLNRLAATEGVASNAAMNFQIRGLLQLYEERRALTAGALGLREGNPQVSGIDEQIRQGHAALRNAVDAAVLSIQSRLDALDVEIAGQHDELSVFPGMETRIGQLSLESTILDETHRYLLGQYQQARMQEATIAPYIQILDSASPAFRIGTTLRQRVILGVLVGLLLGLAGAFFLEYLDQTVKSSADIERVLGVPLLGAIPPHDPKLTRGTGGRRGAIVTINNLDPDEPAVESYRALRTNGDVRWRREAAAVHRRDQSRTARGEVDHGHQPRVDAREEWPAHHPGGWRPQTLDDSPRLRRGPRAGPHRRVDRRGERVRRHSYRGRAFSGRVTEWIHTTEPVGATRFFGDGRVGRRVASRLRVCRDGHAAGPSGHRCRGCGHQRRRDHSGREEWRHRRNRCSARHGSAAACTRENRRRRAQRRQRQEGSAIFVLRLQLPTGPAVTFAYPCGRKQSDADRKG